MTGRFRWLTLGLLAIGLIFGGCKSAYYATYEKFGVHKRDLLKKRVTAARDDQKDAQQQFKDALTRLKDITKFDGGQIEKAYNSLKGEYDDCVTKAGTVRSRIKDVETVAADLFKEWEKEISEYNTPSLRETSRAQLTATRKRYDELHLALKSAEQSMTPVLTQFHDYVLFLKHNLNAQAIASLKNETTNIQEEINKLIEQMNRSIARTDEFIKTLP